MHSGHHSLANGVDPRSLGDYFGSMKEKTMAVASRQKILAQAVEVFGSRASANAWFRRPAMALEQRTPASMLTSEHGRGAVRTLLIQLEHCVYV